MYSLKVATGKTCNYIQIWHHIPGYFILQHERRQKLKSWEHDFNFLKQ